jgi:hypothetical protein
MPFLIQLSCGREKIYVCDEYVKTEEDPDDDNRDVELYKFKIFTTVDEALPFAFATADLAKISLADLTMT